MKTYKVPQVVYFNWNEKLATGHENYWENVRTISQFIANSMVDAIHKNNTKPVQTNSVKVLQYKEKFGMPNVYVKLDSKDIILERFNDHKDHIDKLNKSYETWLINPSSTKLRPLIKAYESGSYPKVYDDYEGFKQEQIKINSVHYRDVYNRAVMSWPQYEKIIMAGASHKDLLYSKEKQLKENYKRDKRAIKQNEKYYKKENLESKLLALDKRFDFIKGICGFKQ